ncbi:FGGY family carbohydrate kinase, partial [Herbiconiux sp. CPCC 203406]
MSIVLGIDLATAEARVQAVDAETGAPLAERRQPLTVVGAAARAAGRREQPAVHGRVALDLVAAVVADLGERAREVRALAVTGTSGTVVPVDPAGSPVGDAVLYDDPRGAELLDLLADEGFDKRPRAALARAAWMHAAASHAASSTRYVFTPDLVVAALAGRPLPSDTSHALKSGIDPVAGRWDERALALLGLPVECLPELVAPGRVIGEVQAPVTALLGLPHGVLIVSGMTDGSTGQIATGAVSLGDTVGVLGTTLVLKAVSSVDVVDDVAGVYSHVAPDGLFWPGGASNTGAGVLRHGATAGFEPVSGTTAVADTGPASSVSYPLAGPGERFPVADHSFEGFAVPFDGSTGPGSRPDSVAARVRAVYEGVAFVERFGLERLAALGVEQQRHHLAGGASASGLWNLLRASALGRPVVVAEGAGSARGA